MIVHKPYDDRGLYPRLDVDDQLCMIPKLHQGVRHSTGRHTIYKMMFCFEWIDTPYG